MSVGREGCGGGGGRHRPAAGGGTGGEINSIHKLEFYRRKKDWRLDRDSASPENVPDKIKLALTKLQPSKLRPPKIWNLSSFSQTQMTSKIAAVFPKTPPKSSDRSAGGSKLIEKTCETSTGDSKEITSEANTGRSKFSDSNSDSSKLIDTTCETNTGCSKFSDSNSDSSKLIYTTCETNAGGSKFCEANSNSSKLIEKTCEKNMDGSKVIEDENVTCFDQTYSVDERYRSTWEPCDSVREAESIATHSQWLGEGTEVWIEPSSTTLLDMDVVSASFLHQSSLEEPTDEVAFAEGARLRAHSSQTDLASCAHSTPTYSEVASKAKKNHQTLKEALLPPPANQRHTHTLSSTSSTTASTAASQTDANDTTEHNNTEKPDSSRSSLNDSVRGNRDDNYREPTNKLSNSPNSNPSDVASGQWGDIVEDISRLENENDRRFATNNKNYTTRVWRNRQQDAAYNDNITNAWSSHDANVDSNHNNDHVGGNSDNNVYVTRTCDDNVGSNHDDNAYAGGDRDENFYVGSNRDDNVNVGSNRDDNVYVASNRDDNFPVEHNFSDYDQHNYTFYGYPSLAQHRNDQIEFMDTYNKNLDSLRVETDRLKTEFMEFDSSVASPNWKYGEVQQNYPFVEPNNANGFYEPRHWDPRNNVDNRFEIELQNEQDCKAYPQQKIIRHEIHTTTIDYGNSKVYVDERTSVLDPSVVRQRSFNYYGNCYYSNSYDANQYESTPFRGNRYYYEGHQYESNQREDNRYESRQYEGNSFESNPYGSNRYDHYGMHGQNSFMYSPQGLNAFVSVQRPVFKGNSSTVPTSLGMPWPGRGIQP